MDHLRIQSGWDSIAEQIQQHLDQQKAEQQYLVIECYSGVFEEEIIKALKALNPAQIIRSTDFFKSEKDILQMTQPDVTEDRIFGHMTRLRLKDFMDPKKLKTLPTPTPNSLTILIGPNATQLLPLLTSSLNLTFPQSLPLNLSPKPYALSLIYADSPRWEIQTRMKAHKVHGLGVDDHELEFPRQYKRGFFVDWRVCDRQKQELYNQIDFFLDTHEENYPRMITGSDFHLAMEETAKRPFRVVPYFDPGPWGGQWMKEVCDLDKEKENFAWCFDCVPEENSLKIFSGTEEFEMPAINLVFTQSKKLLGEAVEARFGKEFPIRFDFLDTMGGGNLSFQVHPDSQYIRETFGLHYTQDESYYLLDAGEDATVYLGIKDGAVPAEMFKALRDAQSGGPEFPAKKFVNIWPAKKHDHFLIPAGTVHCSGKNSMVLEISSTPYIFTFKMWDWNRMGLDGTPRPINIDHAEKVINWDRKTDFTRNELVNQITQIAEGDGWREEKTGLHRFEFIETRRHWFTKPVKHQTEGSVNVINLIEGREALVSSPTDAFVPFELHYAETFIIPEAVKEYIISPHGESQGREIATIKARIRV